MKWKIVADSSSDMAGFQFPEGDIGFETAPLTLTVGDKVFVDDENIDTKELVTALRNYKGAAHSACPSPEAFAAACREADNCFILTITGALSGSYNSALAAKKCWRRKTPPATSASSIHWPLLPLSPWPFGRLPV